MILLHWREENCPRRQAIDTRNKEQIHTMASLTDAQFEKLLTAMTKTAIDVAKSSVAAPEPQARRNDPAALGPMRQCILGEDKIRKLTIFEDWLEEAESRMEYIGSTTDKGKSSC